MTKYFITTLVLIIFTIVNSFASKLFTDPSFNCPKTIDKWCNCEEHSIGFYIQCAKIPLDLVTIVDAVTDLRIDQLTITQVNWKVKIFSENLTVFPAFTNTKIFPLLIFFICFNH